MASTKALTKVPTNAPAKPMQAAALTEAAALSLVLALLGAGPPQADPSRDPLHLRRQARALARSSATLRTQLLLLAYRHAALQAQHARCTADLMGGGAEADAMAEDEERMAALVERLERGLLSLSSDNTQLKVCLCCRVLFVSR